MMEFQRKITELKKKIDREIEKSFNTCIIESKKKDVFLAEALQWAKNIALSGGKRLRPMLVYCGAFACGDNDEKKVIKIAAAIELVHIFFLIHDDIIDKGNLRHGIETVNFKYQSIGKKKFKSIKPEQFGDSIAIIIGDMVYAMAIKLILNSGFDSKINQAVLDYLQSVVQNTIIGQSQDIVIENKRVVTEQEVLAMYENKTARYSFDGPLHLGLILGNNFNKKVSNGFSDFALPLGIAFQMQDDIMGIFGDEKKMGKSSASDITEGKRTLLVVKAQQLLNGNQRKVLDGILGNKKITKKEILEFQLMLNSCGALDSVREMIVFYMNKSKRELNNVKISNDVRFLLEGLVAYLEKREI